MALLNYKWLTSESGSTDNGKVLKLSESGKFILENVGSSGIDLSSWQMETFTVTATDISNKYITLSLIPAIPLTHVEIVVQDAPPLVYGIDFSISGTTLTWDSSTLTNTSLDGNIIAGEWIKVGYFATP